MDLLDRLFGRLVEALDREGARSGSLTVADVYQRLVPYRTVRYEMGVLELAEYEDALLRLLAGERGYLEVQDSGAATEFLRELSSVNPILGIYRDYSEAPVQIRMRAREPIPAGSLGSPPEATEEAPSLDVRHLDRTAESLPPLRPARQDAVGPVTPERSIPALGPREPGRDPEDLLAVPSSCRRCSESLPVEEGVRFCPACGEDQQAVPCARCEAPLRQEWNFCIRCGTRRAKGASAS